MKPGQQLTDLGTASTSQLGKMNSFSLTAVFLTMFCFAWVVYFQIDWMKLVSQHRRSDKGVVSKVDVRERPLEAETETSSGPAEQDNSDDVADSHRSPAADISMLHTSGIEDLKFSRETRERLEQIAAANRRIRHIRIAIENLNSARFPNLADRLKDEITAIEHDVLETKSQLAAELSNMQVVPINEMQQIVRDLKSEVESLRAEVKQLKDKPVEP